jgi:preprotein translocase subunit SecD
MIRSALIALGLSAGAAQGQGLVQTAPLLETCGGTRLVLSAVGDTSSDDLECASDVVNVRIGGVLTQIFDYTMVDGDQIVVSIPAGSAGDASMLRPLLDRVEFTFYDVAARIEPLENAVLNTGQIALPEAEFELSGYVLNTPAILDGTAIESASASFNNNNLPAVVLEFNAAGAQTFADYTSANIGRPIAIVLDGKIMSAPTILSAILGGSVMISGVNTADEAEQLAAIMHGGVLPFDLEINAQEVMDGSDPSADFCP